MVSAAEAQRMAIHGGVLEKRRRTGGWKKKHFFLLPSHWMYFDSMEASSPKSKLATIEIMSVQRNENDPTHRAFYLGMYRKKKEFRAANADDQNAWIQAIESILSVKPEHRLSSSNQLSSANDSESSSLAVAAAAAASAAAPANAVVKNGLDPHDLPRVCEMMKKKFERQLQISRSLSSKDVVEFLKKHLDVTHEQALEIGQELIDAKVLIPLKSHVFEEHDGRFKFHEAAPVKQPKNHLNMRSQSIDDLMSRMDFDAKAYAEDFLRKHSSDKIDQHCRKLIFQKDKTIEALKEEISVNYTSFIRASSEIKTMENSVSQLKTLVLECKRSISTLQNVSLSTNDAKKAAPAYEVAAKKAVERTKFKEMDEFIYELEVSLHERDYDHFTEQALAYKQKKSADDATEQQRRKVEDLVSQFTRKLVEEFNSSMQTSERMHKKESHLRYLIQLGETHLATEMCLQNYSVRIALQLRHVPSYGNALNYVINLSRTFFTSLLVCFEDYEQSFRGQKSSHFISLTVWISAQLERFASEIMCHMFPNDVYVRPAAGASAAGSVAVDVAEFKNTTKFVSSALRYVFYGSRQLELAGLPTAHCLAPHLVKGLISFVRTYAASIKATLKEEIKRERWEMAKRTIRDAETKQDREIILTQSARSYYTMMQQFLRDLQRVLNPSCATSCLPEVHDAVMAEADDLLAQYAREAKSYLDYPKLSSSLRVKQVVGLLTNVAYIQDDCATRCLQIMQEFLPKTVIDRRAFESQNTKIWNELVTVGAKRCGQALLFLTINWPLLDLTEETLPSAKDEKPLKTVFISALLKDLDGITNDQLEKYLHKVVKHRRAAAKKGDEKQSTGEEEEEDEDHQYLVSMMLEAMLQAMDGDEQWWQARKIVTAKDKEKRIGYAGFNQFVGELRVLGQSVQSSRTIEVEADAVVKKISELYHQQHPEKKDALAPTDWHEGYMRACVQSTPVAKR